MNTVGLYIHIPFCKSKCRYCDFCSFPNPKTDTVDAYITALTSEMEEWSRHLTEHYGAPPLIDTVFFGGGTPTLLSISQFEKLTETLYRQFRVSPSAEITAECNPATADRVFFRDLRRLGINRLSIGVQSMNDSELKLLGRLHRAEDAKRTFFDAKSGGFDNLSADVMFGIPSGTPDSLADTLQAVTALSPDHISVYGLQIEEGTYFARHQGELELPDEDTERQMYMDTATLLAEHGFHRYEISNFAKPHCESRHNLKYWHREDYLGLGLAAHSCLGNKRFSNTENLPDYLAGRRNGTRETIGEHDILCESVMLGMRLSSGIDFSLLAQKHGPQAWHYHRALSKYIPLGLIRQTEATLAFTESGMYVSNAILSDILDFDA